MIRRDAKTRKASWRESRDRVDETRGTAMRAEGEDVSQTVLGLSAQWIWHLEEQRPLTLRCGRAVRPVWFASARTYVICTRISTCTYVHACGTCERIVLQPSARSALVQAGRSSTHRSSVHTLVGGGSRTITYCLIQKFMWGYPGPT